MPALGVFGRASEARRGEGRVRRDVTPSETSHPPVKIPGFSEDVHGRFHLQTYITRGETGTLSSVTDRIERIK